MYSAMSAAVRGRVQGVGFRPFVFQIAHLYDIKGTVQNNMDGVKIHLEGESHNLENFLKDLRNKSPRLSKINQIIVEPAIVRGYEGFSIIPSERSGASMLVLPIDSAVCDDCLMEMSNPDDFRYKYPFINCTQCGPRYTIISDLPYDRPYTSMKSFPMCPDCKKEYEDPLNRRHHAQPIACPKCGPAIELFNSNGLVESPSSLEKTRDLLKNGAIVAIKGLGGYHLCCDASNEEAVSALRKRKRRPSRPLAVMIRDIQAVEKYALAGDGEKAKLESPEAPIVILNRKNTGRLAESVAPGMKTIGVMLPYTPLHHLLFMESDLECLIMTSANPSGQPILYKDELAFQYLSGIADYFLIHDREILHPVDDSVIQLSGDHFGFLRRSRGYVPDPIKAAGEVNGIVAFGGQQKTTFAIGRNSQIFVGPHIGDLENIETISHYKNELNHLLKWIQIPQQTAVVDLHPTYQTREILKDYSFKETIEVQHHHAHMASCMADNGLNEPVWGIILDGTGYGEDGNIWGFEIFHGNEKEYVRMAHLKYTPLPGGEKAIKEPWRNAVSMLISLLGSEGEILSVELFPQKKTEIEVIKTMIHKKLNSPLAGTCGRLFDAVSAICGVCENSSYDGEAAVKLSEFMKKDSGQIPTYEFAINHEQGLFSFDFSLMLKQISLDYLNGASADYISHRFHETIVQAIIHGMKRLMQHSGLNTRKVVLSGGSFHNLYLTSRLEAELPKLGIEVYSHKNIPCNDGGLSYGQLIIAAAKRGKETCV